MAIVIIPLELEFLNFKQLQKNILSTTNNNYNLIVTPYLMRIRLSRWICVQSLQRKVAIWCTFDVKLRKGKFVSKVFTDYYALVPLEDVHHRMLNM